MDSVDRANGSPRIFDSEKDGVCRVFIVDAVVLYILEQLTLLISDDKRKSTVHATM